ncbi:hypothetical protein [Saccharopolyspora pogona]|uniref:hypothetical protein n=1 Tax=Saccharopolyspora pogona TaxID=333966 RepID=UPI00168601B7|nr:hypothetical protein [Saccharopolyspora pogona]
MLTRPLFVAASAALVRSSLAGAQPALADPAGLAWEPCGDRQGECTTVEVPIDWNDPGGAKTNIAIGRLPATDPQNRIGVLFVAPGRSGRFRHRQLPARTSCRKASCASGSTSSAGTSAG